MEDRQNIHVSFEVGPNGWAWRARLALSGTGRNPARWARRSIVAAGLALIGYLLGQGGLPTLARLFGGPG